MERIRWPSVERDALVGSLRDAALRPGSRGVLLAGPAGIGKSWLGERLVAAFERSGSSLLPVYANPSLSTIPLGAFGAVLDALGLDLELDGYTSPGADVMVEIERRMRKQGHAGFFVDDLPALDDVCVGLIANLVARKRVVVVLTARAGLVVPPAIQSLIDVELIASWSVAPLDHDECRTLIESAFGGRVDPATVHQLTQSSGANPLYLRELVRGSLESGDPTNGPHGSRLHRTVPTGRLIELIADRFDGYHGAERAALEMLAAAQPLPLDAMDSTVVESLEGAGLVSVSLESGGSQVRLNHPLYGEVLRASTPTSRWRRRLVEAADIMASLRGSGHLRAVTMLIEAGQPVDADDLVRASRSAYAALSIDLAIRLAREAVASEQRADALVALGAALSQAGEFSEATTVLDLALELADDNDTLSRAAQAAGIHHAVRCHSPRIAVKIVEGALARCDDADWRRFLEADLTKWKMMSGDGASGFRATESSTGVARVNEFLIEAMVCAMGGDLERAKVCVAAGEELAEEFRDVLGHAGDLFMLSRFLVQVFDGDLAGASQLATDELVMCHERAGEPEGMWRYCLAMLALHRGSVAAALHEADLAIVGLQWRDYTGLLPTAHAVRATALAQLGRAGEAAAELELIDIGALDDPKVIAQRAQALMWIEATGPNRERGIEYLIEAAELAVQSGHVYLGSLAAAEALRFGHRDALLELLTSAKNAQGALTTLLYRHSAALARDDVDGLVDASVGLEEVGLELLAAIALEQAAVRVTGRDRAERSRRLLQRADRVAAGRDGVRTSLSFDAAVSLTRREREVALLAANGTSNRDIAAELGTSLRTAENHLASAYRKLGVAGRPELVDALTCAGILTSSGRAERESDLSRGRTR